MDTQEAEVNTPEAEQESAEPLSLRDALEAAVTESEGSDQDATESPQDGKAEQPVSQPDKAGEQGGRPKSSGDEKGAVAPESPGDDKSAEDKSASDGESDDGPPLSWNAKGRELYAKADPELQEYIRQREKEQNRGVEKLKNEFEGKAKFAETVWQEVAPYDAMIRAEGGDAVSAIRDLLGMAALMRTGSQAQKRELLVNTAKQFGVDLFDESNADPQQPQQPQNPAYDALQRELYGVKQTLAQQQQAAKQARQTELQSQIESFKSEAPHFDAVREDMAALLDSGRASDLQDAYDKAVWLNPDTRAKVQAEQKAKAEKEAAEKAKADAEKAKKAAGSVTGAPGMAGNGQGAPAKNLRAELERQFGRA